MNNHYYTSLTFFGTWRPYAGTTWL